MLASYRGFGAVSEPLDLADLTPSCTPKSRDTRKYFPPTE